MSRAKLKKTGIKTPAGRAGLHKAARRRTSKPKDLHIFGVKGRKELDTPFHYTASGLDNIYLLSGFELKKTPYGNAVTVENIDGLHHAIAQSLLLKEGALTGKEFRFLRNALSVTQAEFGKRIGAGVQDIGRYERDEFPIPGSVDKGARLHYFIMTCPDDIFETLLERMQARMVREAAPQGAAQSQLFEYERRKKDWHSRHVS